MLSMRRKPAVVPEKASKAAPVLHRFERDGRALLYNAFTHDWRVSHDGTFAPHVEDELIEPEVLLTSFEKLSEKKILRVEVTQACNFACTYCIVYENEIDQLHTHMSPETADELLAWYYENMPGGQLMLIGGEPTLNWKVCRQLIDGLPREVLKEVFTNGVRLKDEELAWLKERNVRILISIDGFERHHEQRVTHGGKTLYDRIIDRYKAVRDAGLQVSINCTVTPSNIHDLVDIHRYFVEDLGAKRTNYSIPHLTVRSAVADDFDMQAYEDAMLQIWDDVKVRGVLCAQFMRRLTYLVNRTFKAAGCSVAGPEIAVYPDGRKSLCTKLDSHAKTASITTADIYAGLPFFMEDCQTCPAIGACGGGCYWDGQMRFDRMQDLRECSFSQRLVEKMLWDIEEWSKDPEFPESLNRHFGTNLFRAPVAAGPDRAG
jgi:uncharacterized protein